MLKIINVFLVGGVLFALMACGKTDTAEAGHDRQAMAGMQPNSGMESAEPMAVANKAHAMVKVPTVQCDMCKAAIEKGLPKTAGILSVMVDVDGKMAHINYDGDKLSAGDIEKAISELGYQANDRPADKEAYNNLPVCCQVG